MNYVVEISPAGCGQLFSDWGKASTDVNKLFEDPEEVKLVVFTGGHDVWPELYGENVHRSTFYNVQRDLYEGKVFEQARKHNIPCVGICRGSQFLCVKSGGKLVQDINGHGRNHKIRTSDGHVISCNSTHHQMQLPGDNSVTLAWAEPRLSFGHYLNGDGDNIQVDMEYEVVFYPEIRSLGCQFHPEWLSADNECVKYSLEVVDKYLFNQNV